MDLHKTAQQLISTVPDFEGHLSKPEAALIAVERHDRDSEEWSSEPRNAFLWIKGNTVSSSQPGDSFMSCESHQYLSPFYAEQMPNSCE